MMTSRLKIIGSVLVICLTVIAALIAVNPFSLTNLGLGNTYEPFNTPGLHLNMSGTYVKLFNDRQMDKVAAEHAVNLSKIEPWLQEDADTVWNETLDFRRAMIDGYRFIALDSAYDHLTDYGERCDMKVYTGECVCYGMLTIAQSYPPSYGCDGPNFCKDDRRVTCE